MQSPAAQTDALAKPDMAAVLSRTHIFFDLHGFLLPTLEAVSNALHGIEAKHGINSAADGRVEIRVENATDPAEILVSVTDNGIGLTAENYSSSRHRSVDTS